MKNLEPHKKLLKPHKRYWSRKKVLKLRKVLFKLVVVSDCSAYNNVGQCMAPTDHIETQKLAVHSLVSTPHPEIQQSLPLSVESMATPLPVMEPDVSRTQTSWGTKPPLPSS